MDPVHKALVGGFFVVAGLVMVLLKTQVQLFYEDLFEGLPWRSPFRPRGRTLTVFILVFGVLSIIGGSLVLVVAFS
jgi:hypothetical protein